MDKDIFKVGNIYPMLKKSDGTVLVNEEHNPLHNTIYIYQNYKECLYISNDDFIEICKKWMHFINRKKIE